MNPSEASASAASAASAAAAAPAAAYTDALRRDARTIGLVGLAHGTSHFFHLLLPPLFPLFIRDFGLSYAELGLLVSTFFLVSGVGQALAGFLVDRVGARPVLFIALGLFASSGLATAAAAGYGGLLLAAGLAGLGNASFHPVDFTILNKRVSAPRLGHAFSVHGISGNLGWAAAPVFMTAISAATGSWRVAAAAASVWALLVMALLWRQRSAIDDRAVPWSFEAHDQPAAAGGVGAHPLAFLKLPSVWLCFSFFFWSTCALGAIQSFASPALRTMYGLPLSLTALVVTGYMLCGAAGMLAGGFLAAGAERLERLQREQVGIDEDGKREQQHRTIVIAQGPRRHPLRRTDASLTAAACSTIALPRLHCSPRVARANRATWSPPDPMPRNCGRSCRRRSAYPIMAS